MALPQLSVKNFEVRQPSTGDKLTLRPFLVSEEKILLQAQENTDSMMTAMKQVMSNCIVGQQLDLDRMPSFDIEYIFLQLRSESVGNQVELMLKHKDECEATEVKINLREVKVHINKDLSNEIMLDDKVGIRMRYPTLEMMEEFGNLDESQVADSSFLLIEKCIDSIYTADGEVHEADNVSKEELSAFINSMNSTQFQKVQKFFEDMPTVRHVIKVPKCVTCGQPFEQVVQGLQSFF
tara:strand:- start:746 stop:1456 length:711 start_codon:yes stop_codon:yes gene_type:complete